MSKAIRFYANIIGILKINFAFSSRRNVVSAAAFVSVFFGLISVLLGQDSNWDLRNYHLYNAYAALNDRLAIDLAPAQLQSYFIPWLDIVYYAMAVGGSPLLAGFVLGAWHGLAFALVSGIAWHLLDKEPRRAWLAPMFGLAGCCSAVFLSELGGTMGDNTTAPLVLGSLLALLAARGRRGSAQIGLVSLAALLLGLGVALKLTNAIYALGLGVSVLAVKESWWARLRNASVLTMGTLLVFALIAVPWLLRVWKAFGNPLFPQFNSWFQAPLALPISVADTRWLPTSVGEALLWPVLFTFNSDRVSESAMPQIIWAVVYVLLLLLAVKAALAGLSGRMSKPVARVISGHVDDQARMLMVFFVVSFVAWMLMFSIHRYLALLELLGPLMVWILAHRLFTTNIAGKVSFWLVALCVGTALVGRGTWGHKGWTSPGFHVESPPHLQQDPNPTVLMVGGEPQAWQIPFLPSHAAFVSVGSNFPESPAYSTRVRQIITSRGGSIHAVFPAMIYKDQERVEKINTWARTLGLASGSCSVVRLLARSSRMDVEKPSANGAPSCKLEVSKKRRLDIPALNRRLVEEAGERLNRYGMDLNGASCRVYEARIGDGHFPSYWCVVTLR